MPAAQGRARRGMLHWLALAIVLLSFTLSMRPSRALAGDALVKYVQSVSIHRNGYLSDRIIYPARSFDPDGLHYPVPYVHTVGGTLRSIFPVMSAALSAPWAAIAGPTGVALFGALLLLGSLVVMRWFWRTSFIVLWWLALGTPLLLQSTGFVDVALANLLVLLGFGLWHPRDTLPSLVRAALGSALMASGVWFRAEALLFCAAALPVGLLARFPTGLQSTTEAPWFSRARLRLVAVSAIGLVGGLALFAIFNWFAFDSILGPRFETNRAAMSSWASKPALWQSLLLFGQGRFGYFGYAPIFLPLLIYGVWPTSRGGPSPMVRRVTFTVLLVLVMATAAAPNEGNIDWGTRYFALTFLPMGIVADAAWQRVRQLAAPQKWIWLGCALALVGVSLWVTRMGHKVIRNSGKQLARVQSDLKAVPADVLVMENTILLGHLGGLALSKPALRVREPQRLSSVLERIRSQQPQARVAFVELALPVPSDGPSPLQSLTGEHRKQYLATFARHFGRPATTIQLRLLRAHVFGTPAPPVSD